MKKPEERQLPFSAQRFRTTHWSMVLTAGHDNTPAASDALEKLCRAYWYPLYAYVRRQGHDAESAKDLTQEFFGQLLGKRLLTGVDPRKGRFRSWLLGVMNHFLAHEWTKAHAQKRGGGQLILSLDETDAEGRLAREPAEAHPPDALFDRSWALTVLEHAAGRLRDEYEADGQGVPYTVLKGFVSTETIAMSYGEAAQRLGWSESAVKSAIHRLRRRYQEWIRDEIRQTVTTESEVDDEIRYLLSVVRG